MTEPAVSLKSEVPRWLVITTLTIALALFLVRNVPWHLDNYDQAKQAFTSYEMVEEGHWWFQHTPSGRIATKPPLAGWISSGIYLLTGGASWEIAWRLPSLVSALMIAGLLWRCGGELFGGPTGSILAFGAFAFNVFTPRLATLVRTDMLLTLFIFLTGYVVLQKIRTGEPWTGRDRALIFVFLLGSILTKGPIAYAFLLPGLLAYLWLARRFALPHNAWGGWWSWAAPLLPFAAWVLIGTSQSAAFYDQVVVKEFLGRFDFGENPTHQHQPPYFYAGHLLVRFAPWSLLLIAFISAKQVRAAVQRDPVLLWLICWVLSGLLVMSAVPSKRFDRIFPIIPPLCLLLVAMARHLPSATWRGYSVGRLTAIATAGAAVISVVYAVHHVQSGLREKQRGLVKFGEKVREIVGPSSDRLAILGAKDEGLLPYVGKTRFTPSRAATDAWTAGEIDWLVLSERDLQKQARRLDGFVRFVGTGKIPKKSDAYLLIGRGVTDAQETAR